MIVRIQNSIPQVKVTSSTIYIIASFLCSILKIKVWIKGITFLGNIYIALVAGKYMKYCPALAFDPPTQSDIYIYIISCTKQHLCMLACLRLAPRCC